MITACSSRRARCRVSPAMDRRSTPCVAWRTALAGSTSLFDVIAGGDEDVVTSERAQAIRDQTGAACVAWEGSGAARAALFNGIGSLEIRAVTDAADKEAPQRFDANLPIAMMNLASVLRLWLEKGPTNSLTY